MWRWAMRGSVSASRNTEKGIEGLVKQMKALEPELIVMEATGGYERLCAAMLAAGGLSLSVVISAPGARFCEIQGDSGQDGSVGCARAGSFWRGDQARGACAARCATTTAR